MIRCFRHLIFARHLVSKRLLLYPTRTRLAYRESPEDLWDRGAPKRADEHCRDHMGITFLYLHRIRSIRIHKINGKFQTIYFASFPQEHVPKTEDGSGLIRLCLNQFPRFLTGCTFCLEIIVKSRNLFDILFYFITINYHCRLASNFENKQLNMLVSSFPYHRKRVHLYMG